MAKKLFLLISMALAGCGAPRPCDHCAATAPGAQPALVDPQLEKERPTHEAIGTRYSIATQGPHASEAAAEILEKGGNLIDAYVAASFTISVERPASSGLGGGGFLLYREAKSGKAYAVDFRERAPLAATRDMYLKADGEADPKRSLDGALAIAVPGLVAGLTEVHERFGKLPIKEVMAPAIRLAEKGAVVYPSLASAIQERLPLLQKDPGARKIFLHPDGSPLREGELLVQKDLAQTLRRIARRGRKGFYEGPTAARIVASSKKLGGILTLKDLRTYKVKWREPLRGTFHGYELLAMPPPSSGGVHVIELLNTLEGDPLEKLGALSTQAVHRTASAFQLAYADRALYLGDPDFAPVPVGWLTSKGYGRERRALIDTGRAKPADEVQPGSAPKEEHPETTHLSLLDREGDAIASTQTINYTFGSTVVAEGTGIVLNDEMDDFSAKPGAPNVFGALGDKANSIAPLKTPLSSMSPTIVLEGGRARLVVGAPGGTHIITCVAETLLNYLAYGLPAWESVAAWRFHEQLHPDQLEVEKPGPGAAERQELTQLGWKLKDRDHSICRVEMAAREGETLHSVSDPRDVGEAIAR